MTEKEIEQLEDFGSACLELAKLLRAGMSNQIMADSARAILGANAGVLASAGVYVEAVPVRVA